jgi:hypothetical protein
MQVTHLVIKKSDLSLVISTKLIHMMSLAVMNDSSLLMLAKFTYDQEVSENQKTAQRVAGWQAGESIPVGHSASLMEVGRRILKGHVGAMNIPVPVVMVNTEHLVKQAEELKNQEERLKNEFPAATKAMDPEDESNSLVNIGVAENGHESEESGVVVDREEYMYAEPNKTDKSQETCVGSNRGGGPGCSNSAAAGAASCEEGA